MDLAVERMTRWAQDSRFLPHGSFFIPITIRVLFRVLVSASTLFLRHNSGHMTSNESLQWPPHLIEHVHTRSCVVSAAPGSPTRNLLSWAEVWGKSQEATPAWPGAGLPAPKFVSQPGRGTKPSSWRAEDQGLGTHSVLLYLLAFVRFPLLSRQA